MPCFVAGGSGGGLVSYDTCIMMDRCQDTIEPTQVKMIKRYMSKAERIL